MYYTTFATTNLTSGLLPSLLMEKASRNLLHIYLKTGPLIKCDKKSEIMWQFRAQYGKIQGSIWRNSGLIMR